MNTKRYIQQLESELATLKQMQVEYNAFLNYVVVYYGTHWDINGMPLPKEMNVAADLELVFEVRSSLMKLIPPLPIRSEISADGSHLSIRRFNPKINHNDAPRIITP